MKILVTGAAGFIGYHTAKALLARGDEVVGLDNLNHYYDVNLKHSRLEILRKEPCFEFVQLDLSDRDAIAGLFATHKFHRVVHLAAQAGVRYSIENPFVYVDSNVLGTLAILEACRQNEVEHLVYASSSSVYGANEKMPFSTHHNVDHPVSLYAATKKSNELMAHSYASLYGLPVTGLRFFTVYGPFGRPDMALFRFTENILNDKPIDIFNFGHHRRDFTYVDDIVAGVTSVLDHVPLPNPDWSGSAPDPGTSSVPYRLYNMGNQRPIDLIYYIEVLENCLGRKAKRNLLPKQPGDMLDTWADVEDLVTDVGYCPDTSVEDGVQYFVDWYVDYYNVKL